MNKNTNDSATLWDALEKQLKETDEALKRLDAKVGDLTKDPRYVAEALKTQIAETVARLMRHKRLNAPRLAKRLRVERQYVNRVLQERANFTLASLAKLAVALDCRIEVKILPRSDFAAVQPFQQAEVSAGQVTQDYREVCVKEVVAKVPIKAPKTIPESTWFRDFRSRDKILRSLVLTEEAIVRAGQRASSS